MFPYRQEYANNRQSIWLVSGSIKIGILCVISHQMELQNEKKKYAACVGKLSSWPNFVLQEILRNTPNLFIAVSDLRFSVHKLKKKYLFLATFQGFLFTKPGVTVVARLNLNC